jgi:hypothetical protein
VRIWLVFDVSLIECVTGQNRGFALYFCHDYAQNTESIGWLWEICEQYIDTSTESSFEEDIIYWDDVDLYMIHVQDNSNGKYIFTPLMLNLTRTILMKQEVDLQPLQFIISKGRAIVTIWGRFGPKTALSVEF